MDAFRPEATFESTSGPAPSGVGLPALSVPKGGGAVQSIGEKFSANAATGTTSLTVPIATSSGRAGFNLGLGLSYDSGAGNGPFGLGWRLSVPAISRKTDKGIPRYVDDAESDVFILAGAEDLVPVREGSDLERGEYRVRRYRPRVEGAFSRIERWTNKHTGASHWKTTGRDNVSSIFGRHATTRISDPEDPRNVFSWLLEETRDDRGNVVRYSYKGEDGEGVDRRTSSEANRFVDGKLTATAQRYLKRIEYGNHRPNDTSRWLFEVVFDYGEHGDATPEETRAWPVRMDPFSTHRPGFEVRTYRLCRRVLMFHRFDQLGPAPYLVRSTDFEYEHKGHLTKLKQVTQAGYRRDERTGRSERATLPPLDLFYVEREIHGEIRVLDPSALDGIPGGVDGVAARWVDLDGEGISGVLLARDRGWYYKSNLGGGRLSPPTLLPTLPSLATLGSGGQQLADLAGDGRLDLVQYTPPALAGFFERTADGDWTTFTPFRELPNIDFRDPNLRFLDVDGDGLADLLITRDDALVWYRSRGKDGFEPPLVLAKPNDETQGAAVIFADGTETILLADMSGDGLMDIVRVRNGEVCYWPNLGYGRFGRKITMDQSPWFSEEDLFDPRKVHFADLDGSGTADLIYLGSGGVRVYFNESGNRLSGPIDLALPLPHSASAVGVIDLFGTGTSCIYWSSSLPNDEDQRVQYVDLMGGQKPHLLARFTNGMGGETRIAYSTSTAFYLQDKADDRPWITRLPFPVHVVERVERFDHVAATRITNQYRYHHGFFDGVEREFRGFAYVEQLDAETIGAGRGSGLFPDVQEDLDDELRLPPTLTRTWFHTGAWLGRERMETALARGFYKGDPHAFHLPEVPLPAGLSADEGREAARALRGRVLRQEVYAEDGRPESVHPYSVTEHTYGVRLLHRAQPDEHREGHAHAVFLVHASEDLTAHYERSPHDPRIQHQLVLDVDDFGNVLRSAAVAYPRRRPAHHEQERLWCTLSEDEYVNRPDERDWYRVGVSVSATSSELTGIPAGRMLTVKALSGLIAEATEIPFEESATAGLQRRVVARQRALYYRDDLAGPLPLGQIESRALPFETWSQAFTHGLVSRVYGRDADEALLTNEGRYRLRDGAWWAPSARTIPDPAAFYQPVATIDAFGERSLVRYDALAMLPVETEDAAGNKITAGTRDAAGVSTYDGNDYRVLAPRLLCDANLNRLEVAFDALGLAVRIAKMGKAGAGEGDTLEDPTTRIEYDLHRYQTTGGAQPAFVHTSVREKHGAANRRWQESYSYADGSSREIMRKVQAPPGEVPVRGPDGRLLRNPDGTIRMRFAEHRWIGTGRTVFDNKGNPVKQYEPFFADNFEFESDRELSQWGVTPILRYDPLGRLIQTDMPDGTLRRAMTQAWASEAWDENDTVLESRWYRERGSPDPSGPEPRGDSRRRAAWLAARHANTPARVHVDSLGRPFLSEADNQDRSGLYRTRTELDVSGNTLAVVDARGVRTVDGQVFDMLRRPLYTRTADASWSRVLLDVTSRGVRCWNARGLEFRYRYDELRRPTHLFVHESQGHPRLVARHLFGEQHAEAIARNLRGRLFLTLDGAGVAINARYDFKGNLFESDRRLLSEYHGPVDWSVASAALSEEAIARAVEPLLESETFTSSMRYDALDRVVSAIAPDGSDTRPEYDESSRIRRIEVRRDGGEATTFVESIQYNARGQTIRLARGNQAVTSSEYDPTTFRLATLRTTRPHREPLQDLGYEYDAVGNITEIRDGVSFGNASVPADGFYEYDALYRLTRAEGREHPGQQPSPADAPGLNLAHPHDFQSLRRYREIYSYDPVGNFDRVAHQALDHAGARWVRRYQYESGNSRLLRTSGLHDDATTLSEQYRHDVRGNMTAMPHLSEMRWDYADRLVAADLGGGGHVFFTYDAAGKRVRKVHDHGEITEERIYFGGYEVYRKRKRADLELERQTLHVMSGGRRLAMLDTKTIDDGANVESPTLARYPLDNHLGSSTVEVDEACQVISYEEYLPFGATALRAGRAGSEADWQRYRYTGKERDEETGLYYYGARYYAAWLGRWTSVDPSPGAGANGRYDQPYAYVQDRPTVGIDPDGRFFWFAVLVVAIVVTGEGVANAPENEEQARNAEPSVSDTEFLIHATTFAATAEFGGGLYGSVAKATGSKILGGIVAGEITGGLQSPIDLAIRSHYNGRDPSGWDYARSWAGGTLTGGAFGGVFGAGSRIFSGPVPPPRLPFDFAPEVRIEGGSSGRTWQDFLPQANEIRLQAYAKYGGADIYMMEGGPPGSKGPSSGDLASVDPLGEPFADPDPPGYDYPSRPVGDHRVSRAIADELSIAGADDPANLDTKTWEANARKGGLEGAYLRALRAYMRMGLSQAEAEYVLQGELDYILNDVIARPVDPAALDTLPTQSIDPAYTDPSDLVCR